MAGVGEKWRQLYLNNKKCKKIINLPIFNNCPPRIRVEIERFIAVNLMSSDSGARDHRSG